jgi:hypothetical protein
MDLELVTVYLVFSISVSAVLNWVTEIVVALYVEECNIFFFNSVLN